MVVDVLCFVCRCAFLFEDLDAFAVEDMLVTMVVLELVDVLVFVDVFVVWDVHFFVVMSLDVVVFLVCISFVGDVGVFQRYT